MKKKTALVICGMMVLSLAFGCTQKPNTIPPASQPSPSSEVGVNPSEDTSEEDEKDLLVVDYQFYSEDQDGKSFSIPQTVERGGVTYTYTGDAEIQVSEIMECIETTFDIEVEEKEDLENEYIYVSEKTGRKYTLKKGDLIYWSEPCEITKIVSQKVQYGPRTKAPSIPQSKTLTYFSKLSQKNEEVEAQLIDSGSSEPYWLEADDPIHGLFYTDRWKMGFQVGWDDEANYGEGEAVRIYIINDTGYEDSEYPSWEGYQNDVIKYTGLDPNKYRVVAAGWDGDSWYEVKDHDEIFHDGLTPEPVQVWYRKAAYPYEALVQTYWANYEAKVKTMGYKTRVTYFTTVEDMLKEINKDIKDVKKQVTKDDIAEDISTMYKVSAKAVYKKNN